MGERLLFATRLVRPACEAPDGSWLPNRPNKYAKKIPIQYDAGAVFALSGLRGIRSNRATIQALLVVGCWPYGGAHVHGRARRPVELEAG